MQSGDYSSVIAGYIYASELSMKEWIAWTVAGSAVLATTSWLLLRKRSNPSRSSPSHVTISKIIIYPIKGCGGVVRYSCDVSEHGLVGDREYALVNVDKVPEPGGCFSAISQSYCPKIAKLKPTLIEGNKGIKILDPTCKQLPLVIHPYQDEDPQILKVRLYGDEVQLIDQGDEAGNWFSEYFGFRVRLGRVRDGLHRIKGKTGNIVYNSLHYKSNVLLLSEDSLDKLCEDSGIRVGEDRFRPNIVIKGCGPFAEDHCTCVRTADGKLLLDGIHLCIRCTYPGVDQETGVLNTKTVGIFRKLRNASRITYNPKYTKDWKPQDYLMGVYVVPKLVECENTRMYIGQTVTLDN